MEITFSPYELQRTDKALTQKGCLVRVNEASHWGVADLCPRIELEDKDLQTEIRREGFLYKRAIELAREDLQARRENQSLLFNEPVPNNILVTNYSDFNFNDPALRGMTLKIKGNEDTEALALVLNKLQIDVKIRLDFNSCLNEWGFQNFLNLLQAPAFERIEYIEDPAPFSSSWMRWNKKIPLAFDFQDGEYMSEFARYRIIKPVREALPVGLIQNYTLTSAMDHPVGLAHGLRIAQQDQKRLGHKNICGFLTLGLYVDTGFYKYFAPHGSWLNFSTKALSQSGIGMTETLQTLKWVDRATVLT
jgi:o-succinylbenzoate synthase